MENKKTLFDLIRTLFNAYPGEIGHFVGLDNIQYIQVEYGPDTLVEACYFPLPAIPFESGSKVPHLVLIDEIGKTGSPQKEGVRLLLMGDMEKHRDTPPGVTKNLLPFAEIKATPHRFSGEKKHEDVAGVTFEIEISSSRNGYLPLIIDSNPRTQAMYTHYRKLTELAFQYVNQAQNEWVTGVFAPKGKGSDEWIPTHVNFKALVPVS